MNIEDINTTCFILALIIRDDGERILLGDGFYEFKDSLQHFQPNTFQNDIVELQGTDGQLLAGQVRRTASQPFDGFIGDATTNRELIEQKRREFIAFFRKKHYYTAVYIFPNGTTIQRERGYIVDAPSAPEMWQKFPEYHIALNFEDPNYYEYEEDESGAEIYAHEADIRILADFSGGLVWDYDGAVSSIGVWSVEQILEGALIEYTNPLNVSEPFTSNFQLKGATEQTTYTGKNLWSSEWEQGYINPTDGQNTPDSNNIRTKGYIAVIPDQHYSITRSITTSYINVRGYDASKAYLGSGATVIELISGQGTSSAANPMIANAYRCTIAPKAGVSYLRFNDNSNDLSTKYMMVLGDTTPTDYEPYVGGVPSPNPDYPQSVQTMTGEQDVFVSGKNLFDFQRFITENVSNPNVGVQRGTATWTDNSITITATSNDAFTKYSFSPSLYPNIAVPKHTDMTLSWKSSHSGTPHKGMIYVFGRHAATGGADVIRNVQDQIEQTTFNTGDYDMIAFRFGVNYAGDTLTYSDIQLEFGDEKTDFVPFMSIQHYEINLGKNLLDGSTLPDTVPSSGQFSASAPIKIKAGKYRYAAYANGTLCTESNYYAFTFRNGQTSVVGLANPSSVFDITEEQAAQIDNVLCYFNGSFTSAYKNKALTAMICAGTELGDYKPYLAPLELCKIGNYIDRPFKNTPDSDLYDANLDEGAWYIHRAIKKVVWDGLEAWTTASNYCYHTESDAYVPADRYTIADILCDNFTPTIYTLATGTALDYAIALDSNNAGRFALRHKDYLSASTLKTWLSTHNTTVYYALATPTNEKITEQALIDDLEAIIDNGKWFAGANNAFLIPAAGPQGEMRIGFYTDYDPSGEGYEWEFGTINPQNIITVEGIDRTLPIWEVQGPATNPTLTNATTNQSITWEGTVPSGQTLTVDMANQTATMEGANVFAGIEGEWIELAVGNNIISYTATGATEPSKLKWNGVVG